MKSSELMEIAMRAGEIMLTGGAEIYRVEETIIRICDSYRVKSESFVLPTGIFISIKDSDGGMQTSFKRIRQRTVDLYKIERVNSFSRNLEASPMDYKAAAEYLACIESVKTYSLPVRLMAVAAGSFVFTLLIKGNYFEGIAAVVIGLLTFLIKENLSKKGLFQFLGLFFAGLVAGFTSLVTVHFFPALNEYRIIIGSIILYLPGVAITNGIKDALYGDIAASMARLGEAFLTAIAVAVGVGVSLSIGLNWW